MSVDHSEIIKRELKTNKIFRQPWILLYEILINANGLIFFKFMSSLIKSSKDTFIYLITNQIISSPDLFAYEILCFGLKVGLTSFGKKKDLYDFQD